MLNDNFHDSHKLLQVSGDAGQHEALICHKCFLVLDKAHQLRQQAKIAEIEHFQVVRNANFEENEQLELPVENELEQIEDFWFKQGNVDVSMTENEIQPIEYPISSNLQIGGNNRNKPNSQSTFKCPAKLEDKKSIKNLAKILAKNSIDNFECSNCNKIFGTMYQLKRHILRVHEKLKRFACDKCPIKFYDKYSLKVHHVRHIKNLSNKLKLCNNSDSNRRFKCNHINCGKFYLRKCDLKVHQGVHSGKIFAKLSIQFTQNYFADARPYVCVCGRSYKYQGGLNRHENNSNH